MLKFPCLVLDHDDTVVQSESTINYPYFCYILDQFRPGQTMSEQDYIRACHDLGFAELCREHFSFTEEELAKEHLLWMDYILQHTPDPYPGIDDILQKQKQEGGLVCVVSHSSAENILRDYRAHFSIMPDAVYGWELPEEQRKPHPFPLTDIMEKFQLQPQDILVVDDMKLAWMMTHPLQGDIAFAAWGKLEFPELSKEMTRLCDYSFDSTRDLEKFLFD